jgi:hypothetical protein
MSFKRISLPELFDFTKKLHPDEVVIPLMTDTTAYRSSLMKTKSYRFLFGFVTVAYYVEDRSSDDESLYNHFILLVVCGVHLQWSILTHRSYPNLPHIS